MEHRKNMRVRAAAVALLAVLLSAAAEPAQAAKVIAPTGPHRVGFRIERMAYEGRTLVMAVWYPAIPAPRAKPYAYAPGLTGAAVLNAAPDRGGPPIGESPSKWVGSQVSGYSRNPVNPPIGGPMGGPPGAAPYPLVIYIHGGICCGIQSLFLPEDLASQGYVVAAPDHDDGWNCTTEGGPVRGDEFAWSRTAFGRAHPPAGLRTAQAILDTRDWRFRVRQVSATIDHLLAMNADPGPFAGLIDPERIGVMGHSVGGWAAMMAAGVEIDCRPDRARPKVSGSMSPTDLCDVPAYRGRVTSLREPRVKAALALSPAIWLLPDNGGEAAAAVPVMIINGDRYDAAPADIEDSFNHLPAPRYLVYVTGADHFVPEDLFISRLFWRPFYPRAWWGYPDQQRVYRSYSAGFFDAYLKGDGGARDYIGRAQSSRVKLTAVP